MVDSAIDAQKTLLKQDISVKVIDMHTIKPLDEKLVIKCAKKTGAIITAEEHSIIGGLGSSVAKIYLKSSEIQLLLVYLHLLKHDQVQPSDLDV